MSEYSAAETARRQIAEICRRLDGLGYTPSNDACVSYRLPNGHVLTLPTGVYRRKAVARDIVEVDGQGKMTRDGGFLRPSPDTAMHLAIYDVHRSMQAIINAEPPFAVMCSMSGRALDDALVSTGVVHLGKVPILPFALPGSPELKSAAARECAGRFALLLENRGAIVWGDNLFEACARLETLERCAMISFCLSRRERRRIPKKAIEKLIVSRAQYGVNLGGTPHGSR
ncbi:MAG: class II aldolase/adducin family protein [Synergistaceae bacterium]|jgi:L-fuculose-phosphate aldolase|nr:class II aldolase/adducin family protein [Synergistaceae bacterium]